MSGFEIISKLFFPPRCGLCNEVLPFDFHKKYEYSFDNKYSYVCACEKCVEKIPEVPLVTILPEGSACISPLYYKELGKESILRLKYKGYKNSAVQLGRLSSRCVMQMYDRAGIDVITYVPMTKEKLRERRYNQAELLAEMCGELLNIETQNLLIKTRDNLTQHNLSAKDRRKNVENVYEGDKEKIINDKTILLVDDIVTTGYTLSDCVRALKEAGAKSVLCVTAAKSVIGW